MSDTIEKTVALLKEWHQAEEDTIKMTNEISEKTNNPAIKIFMTAIRSDSGKHKLIQEFLLDALTKQSPVVSFDEIAAISGAINDHLALEQKTVDFGNQIAEEINLPLIKDLINYLLDDERKHVTLLMALSKMKEAAHKNT